MNFNLFGCSFATGYGVTESWVDMLENETGIAFDNGSVNGGMFSEQAEEIYCIQPMPEDVMVMCFGPNEQRRWGVNAATLRYWYEGILALTVFASTPNKVLGKDGVKTGSWSNTGVYGLGVNSFTANDTNEFDVFGDVVYVGSIKQDIGLGTFKIYIDEEYRGEFSCAGGTQIRTLNWGTPSDPLYHHVLGTLGPMGLRFECAEKKWHHVTFKSTAAQYDGPYRAYAEWVAGNVQEHSPRIILTNTPRQDIDGYASLGGSPANVLAYCNVVSNIARVLRRDGLNVRVADWYSVVNSWSDNIHPDDEAQEPMFRKCFEKITEE